MNQIKIEIDGELVTFYSEKFLSSEGSANPYATRWIEGMPAQVYLTLPPYLKETVRYLMRGISDKQIAYELNLALATVKKRHMDLYYRLHCNNRNEALLVILGILPLDVKERRLAQAGRDTR